MLADQIKEIYNGLNLFAPFCTFGQYDPGHSGTLNNRHVEIYMKLYSAEN